MTSRPSNTRTPAALAELAYAEVLATRPRTPARRAAVCLYIAASVPPAKSLQAVKNAITTFGADTTQRAALELLGRLATEHANPTDQEDQPACPRTPTPPHN